MKKWLFFLLLSSIGFSFNVNAEAGVNRSVFTKKIERTEPVSNLVNITNDTTRIYFFTEIIGLKGQTITHRWEYNGRVLAEVALEIKEDHWRTWSSKNMLSSWLGSWQVSVLDEGGNILEQKNFEYIAPQIEEPPKTPASN